MINLFHEEGIKAFSVHAWTVLFYEYTNALLSDNQIRILPIMSCNVGPLCKLDWSSFYRSKVGSDGLINSWRSDKHTVGWASLQIGDDS